MTAMADLVEIFGEEGLFARQIPGFTHRPGQLQMALAVERLLADEEAEQDMEFGSDAIPLACSSLAVEAETGLGKTLAYLVPAVCSGRKVVISTNTRNLQDQILHREIPLIKRYLAPKLQAICVKGRQNYLCLYRWYQLLASQRDSLFTDTAQEKLDAWSQRTRHGDRAELAWLSGASPLWQKICCQNHFCLGSDCPEYQSCFLTQLRRDAANADLLVVNHHLLFSDLAVRRTGFGEVLPRYEAVFFDEAHHLEDVATTFFGRTFSRLQALDLAADMERSAQAGLPGDAQQELMALVAALNGAVERFALAFPAPRGRFSLDWEDQRLDNAAKLLDHLAVLLEDSAEQLDELATRHGSQWEQYSQRAAELAARIRLVLAAPSDTQAGEEHSFTYWYERTERNLSVSATPVEVAEELHKTLYATARHCLFTSATLTTGGSFSYFFSRMGLAAATPSLSLASPFDYAGRTLIYVPERNFPAPADAGYQQALHTRLEELVQCANGRALLLFTSVQAMQAAHASLAERLPFPVFMQGEAARHTLLNRFSQEIDSVLFAVASFWEGVDVPGESLSLVVMDKLPFEVPTDPVIMARMRRIASRGGNPFFLFQIPKAIFTQRQGAGRLMRTTADRGVIAILDVRLLTKGYGRQFLNSLPSSPLTHDLARVADFFSMREQNDN